jgi:hypothetical protein
MSTKVTISYNCPICRATNIPLSEFCSFCQDELNIPKRELIEKVSKQIQLLDGINETLSKVR